VHRRRPARTNLLVSRRRGCAATRSLRCTSP